MKPWEELSFLYNSSRSLETVQPEIGTILLEKHLIFEVSGALRRTLENLCGRFIHTPRIGPLPTRKCVADGWRTILLESG